LEVEQHIAQQLVGHRKNRKEIKKFLKFNENEKTIFQSQGDTANAVLRSKFIAMSAYVKSTERWQIKGLMLHLNLLQK
jgi:hypothetical protein